MRTFCFVLGLVFWTGTLWGQKISDRRLLRQIKKIPSLSNAYIGVHVESLEKDIALAGIHETQYFTPASNTKLLTFLGAIQTFPKLPVLEYAFENDSIAHFKSTAYPLLLHPFYSDCLFFEFFNQKSIWKYHPPTTSPKRQGSGWSWDDYHYYYAASSSVFPIYGNTVQGVLKDGRPELAPAFTVSQDTTVKNLERKLHSNTFQYHPQNWKENDTIYRPFIPSDSLFVELLARATKKEVLFDLQTNDSLNWKTLFTEQEPLLYKGLLQDSDNGIAEALLLMIANKENGQFLPEIAIDKLQKQWESWLPDPLEWVDGSGVSRYNMFTPRSIVAVLQQIDHSLSWDVLTAYFPESGISGTLNDYPDLKNVYAKTGTLRHNHNLSGYWLNSKGERFVFSIMVNHFTAPTAEIRKGITELITWLQKKVK